MDDIYNIYAENVEGASEIDRCPFCGAFAHFENSGSTIKCSGCGACIRGKSREDVLSKWNKRVEK